MVVNLPTELLRSFAAIVDAGSMLKATERVFVSQSALSLQMKRLEDLVQTSLFQREGRRLNLTPAGQSLLSHAREILQVNDRAVMALSGGALIGPVRIGFVQDFAETLLSGVLGRFSELNPETQVQVLVGESVELLELMQSGQLDVLLCIGAPDDPASIHVTPMAWFGDGNLLRQDAVPLALPDRPCRFREAALASLENAGRPYRVVLETPSLAALRAAVQSGLGVTCRSALFMENAIQPGQLPPLPQVAYVSRVRENSHPAIATLADLIRIASRDLR